jgi:16S rRNA (cytidine1402-2'-O)-methyltransferase
MKRRGSWDANLSAGSADGAVPKPIPGKEKSQSESPLVPGLYVTATPIGNARDLTFRALEALKGCDLIAAEDTRVTSKLLSIYGISKSLTAYNDHNAARERPRLLAKLRGGARIALVSDAGTPLVSDPGFKLVREALAEGIAVHALPGASAPLTGLMLAGLPSDRFLFAGFLSSKQGERRGVLEELCGLRATLIFFESPQRLAASLIDIRDVLGNRPAVVARELTKLHEDVRRGDLVSLAQWYADAPLPKGEVTILVGPPLDEAPNFARAEKLLEQALAFMPVRPAADLVAEALDLPRREIYARALALKSKHDDAL